MIGSFNATRVDFLGLQGGAHPLEFSSTPSPHEKFKNGMGTVHCYYYYGLDLKKISVKIISIILKS